MTSSTRAKLVEVRSSDRPWVFTYIIGSVAVGAWPFSMLSSGEMIEYVTVIAVLSLAAIVAIWCAITRPWWRFLVALVVVLGGGVVLMTAVNSGRTELWVALIPLSVAIPIELTLELIGLFFGRFTNSKIDMVEFKEGLQFKIFHLMVLTAVVAVFCAIGQAFAPAIQRLVEVRIYTIILMIISVLSINTLVSTWALLGRQPTPRLIISMLIAAFVIGVAMYFAPIGFTGVWIMIFSIVWLITTIQLALLRSEGVRFVRTER